MSILNLLASSLGRRDEVPNIELAGQIIAEQNSEAVQELVQNLSNKKKDIRHDCIKTLYEVGARQPDLIADYTNEFMSLLQSKDNRMQWGAMKALHSLVKEVPEQLFKALPALVEVADQGSVITRDHCVYILIDLCRAGYAQDVFPLLVEQILKSPVNQLPTYAEGAAEAVPPEFQDNLLKALAVRLDDLDAGPKRRRLEKVIKKLSRK